MGPQVTFCSVDFSNSAWLIVSKNERIYDRVEADTRKSQASFRLFRWLPTEMIGILIQLKCTSAETEISRTGTQRDMLV